MSLPLLSPRRLSDFSPEEFKTYIKSLYAKRAPKQGKAKKKTMREKPITTKITKKGKLSITTRREVKYATEEESRAIEKTTGRGANEVFIALRAAGFITATHEEAERIKGELDGLPF